MDAQRIEAATPSPVGTTHAAAMAAEAQADDAYDAARERLLFSEGIAREVIRVRTEQKLTQAELARRVGTTASAISRIERGDHEPSTATLRRIAEATGTSVVIHFARRRTLPRPASERAARGAAERAVIADHVAGAAQALVRVR